MGMSPKYLRPRASGGFSPKNIAGLQLWFDASEPTSVTLNGSNVSEWRDISGNSVALVQATANNQPTYRTSYVNSKNAITFDGTDWLYQSSLTLASSGVTVFAVAREDVHVDNSGSYVFGPSTGNDYTDNTSNFMEYGNSSELVNYNNTGAFAESGSGTMPLSVCVLNLGATTGVVRRNGTQKGSGVHARSGSSANLNVGARFIDGAPSVWFAAKQTFCELIRYSSSLSDANVSKVEQYLAKKWGITLA